MHTLRALGTEHTYRRQLIIDLFQFFIGLTSSMPNTRSRLIRSTCVLPYWIGVRVSWKSSLPSSAQQFPLPPLATYACSVVTSTTIPALVVVKPHVTYESDLR
jgi:hypothetical protein